jgi:hypothetical protein
MSLKQSKAKWKPGPPSWFVSREVSFSNWERNVLEIGWGCRFDCLGAVLERLWDESLLDVKSYGLRN